jgi:hypothetical protein
MLLKELKKKFELRKSYCNVRLTLLEEQIVYCNVRPLGVL